MKLLRVLAFAAYAGFLGSLPSAVAAPEDLDAMFGSGGIVATDFGTTSDIGGSVAVQGDGKVVVAGYSIDGGDTDFALVRYNADGSLDTSFNATGRVTTAIGSGSDAGLSVALQTDGKIVVAGNSHNGSNDDFAVARFNADGSLDTTFNGTGKVTTAIGSGIDQAYGVALQGDGKVVVAGHSYNGSNYDFALVRYNANGSLDTTFNGTGKVTTAMLGSSDDRGRSLALQSDGKILVAGHSSNGGTNDFALVRYNANGSLDTSFNGTGKVTTAVGSGHDRGESVAVQSDGKIVVAGYSSNGNNDDFALVRYNANGSLDPSFNGIGKLITAIGGNDDVGRSVAVQSDGKIVVAGYSDNGSDDDFVLVRYNADGTLDSMLGGTGKVTTAIGSAHDRAFGLAVQNDGKLLLVGTAYNGSDFDLAVVRYHASDPATAAPMLTMPASGTLTTKPVAVSFTLPEPALDGSVTLTFVGNTTQTLTLANNQGSVGTHSFSFDPENPTLSAAIANGAAIPDGTYTVTLSYQDVLAHPAAGSSASNVVIDTAPPALTLPADIIAEASGASGAVVGYVVSASDTVSGALTPNVSRASGSVFALGTTTVNVSGTDGAGNTQTGSFSVTVQDMTKPALTLPADIIAEATGASGAVVSFSVSASDAVSGAVVPMASPASGSTFPLGTTTVNVSAADGAGNMQTGSFMVTVRDTTKPVIVPGPIIAEATSAAGAVVDFAPAATDTVSTPVVEAAPASGSVFPLGDTTVAVTGTDAAGNVAMGSFVVRVRDTTLPVLTVPGAITAEATSASGAVVTFSPTAMDAVSTPVVASVPGSGSTFPLGPTTVNVTATDAAGNVAHGSFSVTVQDTTAPAIGGLRDRTTSVTTMPDYTALPVTSDLVGVSSVTQAPLPGGALALGPTVVTLTAHDAAGNQADTSFTLTRYPPDPAHTAVFASGDAVPGVGAGATFTGFGVPAINDAGEVAFVGKWTSAIGDGAGIFAGKPAGLVVKSGDAVVGLAAAPREDFDSRGGPREPRGIAAVTFKTFADPVLDAAGHVAFLATVSGAGVTRANDTVLVTNAIGGALEVVVREGASVNLPGAPRIKAMRDVSLAGGEVLFTAMLKVGTGVLTRPESGIAARTAGDSGPYLAGSLAVTRANDAVALRANGSGLEQVVREGAALGASTVKVFKLLGLVGGSPGQSRAHTTAGTATFLALLRDGTQALVESTGGVLTDFVATGDATGGTTLPPATFKSFGVVAAEADRAAFLATLNVGGDVTAANARGIFLGAGTVFEPVARVSDPVPEISGASFKAFLDPVLAPGAASVAFPATLRGEGVRAGNDRAIFYQPEGAPLRAIAREGGQPPGTLAGAKWKSFTSLALPGGDTGPVFHAKLARGPGSVNVTNDAGVWAVDSAGTLRLLFREGDPVGEETVKTFTVLNAVRGSAGVTRAFNDAALVAWRAKFGGGASAIVVTSVP